MTKAVLDLDILAFKASAVGEHRYIEAELPDGSFDIFDNRTTLKEHCKITDMDYKQCVIEEMQFPEDWDTIVHTAKAMVRSWVQGAKCDSYIGYVGLEDSFRNDLPLPDKYKGNREGVIKPVYVDDLKHWFLDQPWGIEATENLESDDWISIEQYAGWQKYKKTGNQDDLVCGVTTDKDHNSIFGLSYNPDKMETPKIIHGLGELYCNKRGAAWKMEGWGTKWLIAQHLLGDSVDNLHPSRLAGKKFGPVKTDKLLSQCETPKEVWFALADTYKDWFGDDFTYNTWDGNKVNTDWLGVLELYFKCFRMKRWVGDDLQIKTVLEGYDYEC